MPTIALGPLARRDAEALVASRPLGLPTDVLHAIADAAAGNPLALVELPRSVAEAGVLDARAIGLQPVALPALFDDALTAWMSTCSAPS